MELKLIVLSVAVFACLVPPALSTGILAKAALVKGAAVVGAGALAKKALIAKGALVAGALAKKALVAKGALLGGALLAKKALVAKGAVVAKNVAVGLASNAVAAIAAHHAAARAKGAAILAAKAAAVNGAVSLAAKGAAVGGAILGAKAAALKSLSSILVPPFPYTVSRPVAIPSLIPVHIQVSPAVQDIGPQVLKERLINLFGIMNNSIERKSAAVQELANAVQNKVAGTPSVYDVISPPELYPVPVVEKLEAVYKRR